MADASALDKPTADWVDAAFVQHAADYDKCDRYYDGTHAVQLTDRMRRFLRVPDHTFTANLCAPIIDAAVDRLIVTTFSTDDEPTGKFASEVWRLNRMDRNQRDAHRCALVHGDAYVVVEWDTAGQRPRLEPNEASLIRLRFDGDDPTQPDLGAKMWTKGEATFLTVYRPGRIERYQREGGGVWNLRVMTDGQEAHNAYAIGSDLMPIPIVPFRNQRRRLHEYGLSDITALIPMQNALNKTLIDLLANNDYLGMPVRWIANASPPAGGFKVYPGALLELSPSDPEKAVQTGEWASESPEGLINSSKLWIELLSVIGKTPAHLLTVMTDIPSGEALKTAESPLIHRVEAMQVGFGNSWEDVIRAANDVTLWAVAAGYKSKVASVAEIGFLECEWRDPETRTDLQEIEIAALKIGSLGIPKSQAWSELGYTAEEIAVMEAAREKEAASATNIGAQILQGFNAGVGA